MADKSINVPYINKLIPMQTWIAGQPINFMVGADTFIDNSGGGLIYYATLSDGQPLPDWLKFNSSTGVFTGTAPNNLSSVIIKLTATNSTGASSSELFGAVTPVLAPVLSNPTTTQTWNLGQPVSFTLPQNTFTDPQGTKLTYSAMLSNGSELPSGLMFNTTTATFSGSVPTNVDGLSIKVTATDAKGLSTSEVFTVATPAAAPIVKNATSSQIVNVGSDVNFSLPTNTFADPQAEKLTYSATLAGGGGLPSWLTFNAATASFSGTMPGSASALSVTVTATDTSGLSTAETFSFIPSPMRAKSFLNTIGVDTHIQFLYSNYGNMSKVISDMQYLGINQARDQLSDGTNGSAPLWNFLVAAQAGIQFTFVAAGTTTQSLDQNLAEISFLNMAAPGSVKAVEGVNEVNNYAYSYNGVSGLQGAINMQQNLYSYVHSSPFLSGVGVDMFTYWSPTNQAPNPITVSGLADFDNSHPYAAGGQGPALWLNPANALYNETGSQGAFVYTETGYSTNSGSYSSVNQDVQAKLTLDTLLDAAKDGSSQTYLYQLMEANQSDQGYGLFDANGAPKEAAVAVHNFTTILQDNGTSNTTFTTAPLTYSISGLPTTADSFLMEKSNGAYDLSVWNEATIWNPNTAQELTVAPTTVTINLGKVASAVSVFDPLSGTMPIETSQNVSKISIQLTDHPLIIEIDPVGSAAAAAFAQSIAFVPPNSSVSAKLSQVVSNTSQPLATPL
jgi:hypothetical protein